MGAITTKWFCRNRHGEAYRGKAASADCDKMARHDIVRVTGNRAKPFLMDGAALLLLVTSPGIPMTSTMKNFRKGWKENR